MDAIQFYLKRDTPERDIISFVFLLKYFFSRRVKYSKDAQFERYIQDMNSYELPWRQPSSFGAQYYGVRERTGSLYFTWRGGLSP